MDGGAVILGYARVSTRDQSESLTAQETALRAAGAQRVYTDTISGARSARPGLDMALSHGIRDGDVLMVTRLDRLERVSQIPMPYRRG
ncbi:recombinase family protein [Kocuria sp. SL71]|uniref:recombinase family protein n=1 Tax=Kocuria sp. SL71 TaxID=2995151 RepID=UPI0022763BE2|nr:recombinase family protein [Kocuria sp. SL71]MCY1685121.1 recombinase family protein [Kocuria sp. SL71]